MSSKLTITPKNDAEKALVKRYLTQRNIAFTVRGEGGAMITKSDEELAAESNFKARAGLGRFRMTKAEKASGLDRTTIIKNRLASMPKVKTAKAVKKSSK